MSAVLEVESWMASCVCGYQRGETIVRNGLSILVCSCGVGRLIPEVTREEYEAQYCGVYHSSTTRHAACTPYARRYAHDRHVARVRWERHLIAFDGRSIKNALDIGCANGAFVDELRALGIEAYGLDPDPAMARAVVRFGTIMSPGDWPASFSLITMHDVLEHLIDPRAALDRCSAMIARGGMLVLDVPDVWGGEGDHHFKAEHLWYFTKASLERLAVVSGFVPRAWDEPIPGKMVLYAEAL